MKSRLAELSDEAVLLLYLADELSAEERAAVDGRLAVEPPLREQLRELAEAEGVVRSCLEADLASARAADEHLVRSVMRELLRRQLEQPVAVQVQARQQRSWPRWVSVASAVAAAVLVGIGLWGLGVFDGSPETQLSGPAAVVTGGNLPSAMVLGFEKWMNGGAVEPLDEAAVLADDLQLIGAESAEEVFPVL